MYGELLLSISYLLHGLIFRALGEMGVLDVSIVFIVDVTTPQAGALSAGPCRSLDAATDEVAHVIGNEYARHQTLIRVFVVAFRVFQSTFTIKPANYRTSSALSAFCPVSTSVVVWLVRLSPS